MPPASGSTIRWFLSAVVIYLLLCLLLRPLVPERLLCNAQDLFAASIFALIGAYCVLVGAAGSPVPMRRDEHPVSFWVIVACSWSAALLFLLCGTGLIHTVCMR